MPTESRKAINRRHYLKNREHYKAVKLAYYHANKDRIDREARSAYHKNWRAENPEKAKRTPKKAAAHYAQFRIRYETKPEVRKRKNDSVRDWQGKNPEKVRNMKLKKKYGITIEDFEAMFKAQDEKCAICGATSGYNFPAVDHCHSTKKVRGLLCQRCNHGIGLFKDDPIRLRAAADYLERARKT